MTKAWLLGSPRSGATADNLPPARAVTMGQYTYTPAAAYSSPDARGTLHRDGAQVELWITESLISEFLTLLEGFQEELSERWNGQGRPGCFAAHV